MQYLHKANGDSRVSAPEIILLSMGFVFYTPQIPLKPAARGADKKPIRN